MKEIWKEVEGYEGKYKVSNKGRIKSLYNTRGINSRILKLNKHPKEGYIRTDLHYKGTKKSIGVHQVVANAFMNPKPDSHRLVVTHINFDRSDNNLSNLKLTTHREASARINGIKGSSKYIGVYFQKPTKMWMASMRIKGKSTYLGSHKTEELAHKDYQDRLKELKT